MSTYYAVATLTIIDPSWVPAYVDEVTRMVERHGGRYLTRTTRVEQLEGDPGATPQLVLLIAWPSAEHAKALYDSDEYAPHKQARLAGSEGTFWLVSGEDVNGIAQIG